jgi:hypothetical protein
MILEGVDTAGLWTNITKRSKKATNYYFPVNNDVDREEEVLPRHPALASTSILKVEMVNGTSGFMGKLAGLKFNWVMKHCTEGVWRLSFRIAHRFFSRKYTLTGGRDTSLDNFPNMTTVFQAPSPMLCKKC